MEKKIVVRSPLRVGNKVLIRTVTNYVVGKIALVTKDEIVLTEASWIADTGRFHDALKNGTLNEIEPYIGPVAIGRGAIVDACNWDHPLPVAQK